MKTIAFSSIKGGTGKSSLCILTANYAAAVGYRVLVADLDLQNSATSYYLDEAGAKDRKNVALALHSEHLAEHIIPTNCQGVDLLASSFDLVKLRAIGEKTFRRILEAEGAVLPYDFLFIDTAPTWDNLVMNALNAADLIITPVAFSQFDFKAALFLRDMIQRDTEKLDAWRVLFNFYRPPRSDNPDAIRNQYEALFRSELETMIAPVMIPESAIIRRSIDTGEKITRSAAKAALHGAIQGLAAYCGAAGVTGRF